METISNILAVPNQGAYYYEDVSLLQEKDIPEDSRFTYPAKTPGFKFVRELAEVVSVGIVSSHGKISWGDSVGVSYSGKSGRDGVFRCRTGLEEIEKVKSLLVGRPLDSAKSFVGLFREIDTHKAVLYGLSQAVLAAVADAKVRTMTEVVCEEWNLPLPTRIVDIQGSSGNDRKKNADKMILNRLPALPHGQIDTLSTQLGYQGEILLDYAMWLKNRIRELGEPGYVPTIHLDVHGSVGKIFEKSARRIADYLMRIERVVAPHPLRMESVVLGNSKEMTISLLRELKRELVGRGSKLQLVADEWANTREDIVDFAKSGAVDMIHIKTPDLGSIFETIETVLQLKSLGTGCLLGGSCIETEISAKISAHIALATQPTVYLAKPGMGIDEAILLTRNEMRRTLKSLPVG